MWPFHYLLPTVKFLSSSYPKACSPPPVRQLLLPQPRTLSSIRFCTAAGADSTRGKFFAGWATMKTSLREALFHFQLCRSGCPSKHSPLCPFPPTFPSALPHVGLLPTALPCSSIPSLLPVPDLHSQTWITSSFPRLSLLSYSPTGIPTLVPHASLLSGSSYHCLSLWLSIPFFFPCTELLLYLLSASSLPTSLNIKL